LKAASAAFFIAKRGYLYSVRLLILDNYDSFTYNLVHLVEKHIHYPFAVYKNDAITIEAAQQYSRILLSPGPGLPSEAGIMPHLLKALPLNTPVLGVCLGMQAIAEATHSPLKNLNTVFHGVATPIHLCEPDPLFLHCPPTFNAGRYHSWVIDEDGLSPDLKITARDDQGLIMAVRHHHRPWCGVQFHPESILSAHGDQIIANWLHHE
jgi:anthranilate synthase component 2